MVLLSRHFFRRYHLHLYRTNSFTGEDESLTPAKGVKSIAFGTPYFGRQWPQKFTDVRYCPGQKKCTVIDDITKADAVVFYHTDMYPWIWSAGLRRNPNRHRQVWVYFGLEPETRVDRLAYFLDGYFNWTLTYRTDSDIVIPYYKTTKRAMPLDRATIDNYTKDKSKMAYIMTTHCEVYSRRLDYVRELQNYIQVDVIDQGETCGKNLCPRWTCDDSKLGYKFYLAFENSLCRDYITEKFWKNSLIHRAVPVVMGPSKADYLKVAPPYSFIYVDDFEGPKELAEYLKMLNSSDVLYKKYFEWHLNYTITESGESLCGLCDALHNDTKLKTEKVYKYFTDFWDLTKHCKDKGRQIGTNIFQKIVLYLYYYFRKY
jgi:hypothetical protein